MNGTDHAKCITPAKTSSAVVDEKCRMRSTQLTPQPARDCIVYKCDRTATAIDSILEPATAPQL